MMPIIRMSIDVPEDIHKIIKTHAILNSQTIKEYVVSAVITKLQHERKFNKETIQAFKDSEEKFNLNKYNSIDELYKKLGI